MELPILNQIRTVKFYADCNGRLRAQFIVDEMTVVKDYDGVSYYDDMQLVVLRWIKYGEFPVYWTENKK